MKKTILKAALLIGLIWLGLVVVRIVSSVSEKLDHKVEELGSIIFDEMTVTFYYDNFLQNNHGLYFTNDSDKFAHTSSSPTITSKDGKTFLYVEFTGAKKIVCHDDVIEPIESIEAKVNDTSWIIKAYILDTENQYYQIGINEEEYTASLCSTSDTGNSSICNVVPDIDSKEILNMVSEWKALSKEAVSNHEFVTFLTIHDNKEIIGGFQSEFIFARSSKDESILSVAEGNIVAYYKLDQNHIEALDSVLISSRFTERK